MAPGGIPKDDGFWFQWNSAIPIPRTANWNDLVRGGADAATATSNHWLDARAYLGQIPYDRVVQIHLAGHTDKGTHCIDTHDDHVIDEVWQLYELVMQQAGSRATMVEWDDHIPEFDVLHDEVKKAARYRGAALSNA